MRHLQRDLPVTRAVRDQERHGLPPLPWAQLARPVAVTLVGGLVFYVLIVELSYRLDDLGVESSATIGAVSAIGSLGTAVGAFLFGRLAPQGPGRTVPLAFAVSGIGLVGLALAPTVPAVAAAAVVTGFGNGLLLPAMLTWALGGVRFEQRGRATGVWTSALFLGQFVCPLVVLGLEGPAGGLAPVLVALGVVAVVMAVVVHLARPAAEPAV